MMGRSSSELEITCLSPLSLHQQVYRRLDPNRHFTSSSRILQALPLSPLHLSLSTTKYSGGLQQPHRAHGAVYNR